MSDHTQFRAVTSFNQPLIISSLEHNLKDWISWSMLKIGGWVNVTTGNSKLVGGNSASTLQKVSDPSYTNNTVFQSPRKDWVYESGVNYASPTGGTFNPLPVKVYSNNVEITGTGSYYINYPEGRVIFSTPQNGTIKAQYSYRAVQVYTYDEANWTMEVNYESQASPDQWSLNLGSGDYSISSTSRMQLPAIVVQPVSRGSSSPFELGTLCAYNRQDVLFHILTENRMTRNNLADVFRFQKGKDIILYDLYKVYASGAFPLDYRGMVVNNPPFYPDIVNNSSLVFRQATIEDVSITNIETKTPNLHWAIVRATLEVIY